MIKYNALLNYSIFLKKIANIAFIVAIMAWNAPSTLASEENDMLSPSINKENTDTKRKAVRPEDVLSDSQNFTQINGLTARKGSVAAFLKNIDLLESTQSSHAQKEEALEMIKELAPVIIAVGLYKHAAFKNKDVEAILEKASKNSQVKK